MKTLHLVIVSTLCGLATLLNAHDGDSLFSEAGLRVGIDSESKVSLSSYEIFGTIETDWSWELSENTRLDLDIETAVGFLTGDGEAVYGKIAPVAELHFADFPLSLVVSSGPSLYSDDKFDGYDIGGSFQFTSSVGVNWDVCENWTVSYRFQHTSNANLGDPNPGLEMHTLSAGYAF